MTKRSSPSKFRINLAIIIELLAVVMVWRGVWALLDVYLFPGNIVMSSIICVVVGTVVLLLDDRLLKELSHKR